ncbi:hypothetical protein NQ317_019060 [Molorchus minor]|uniref:Uncharacterized protein n=1 Tax=Molorchus minor TaxID=1323400 RepID=A0ABQ9JYH7_9CUCU|nr:hypothetical protein NQ317_019060 [Molorchus minor]
MQVIAIEALAKLGTTLTLTEYARVYLEAFICQFYIPKTTLTDIGAVSSNPRGSASSCNSPVPASPRTTGLGRCLSPLFIHSSRGATPDSASCAPPASPLGAIQPDLYLRKDGPLFIGGNNKPGPSLGRLHFRLSYDFDRSDLIVHLIEAYVTRRYRKEDNNSWKRGITPILKDI